MMIVRKFSLGLGALLACGQIIAATHDQASHTGHAPIATPGWTSAPLLLEQPSRNRGGKLVDAHNLNADEFVVFPSTDDDQAGNWTVAVRDSQAQVRSRGGDQGGYHWVGARAKDTDTVRHAATILYFANPGPAPREMLVRAKSELEITPLELPREHRHFRAGERARFVIRLHGQPLAGAPITLDTANGTRLLLHSGTDGSFTVPFPDDFGAPHEEADGHGMPRTQADFVLTARRVVDGIHHTSAFNYHYIPGPYYQASLFLGLGFAALGMLSAAPLLARPRTGDKS